MQHRIILLSKCELPAMQAICRARGLPSKQLLGDSRFNIGAASADARETATGLGRVARRARQTAAGLNSDDGPPRGLLVEIPWATWSELQEQVDALRPRPERVLIEVFDILEVCCGEGAPLLRAAGRRGLRPIFVQQRLPVKLPWAYRIHWGPVL